MSKTTVIMIAGLALGALVPWAGAAELQAGAKLRVTTSSAVLRDAPRPFGANSLGSLPRGATVVFKRKAEGAWLQVEYRGAVGYLPANSLAEAKKFSASSLVSRVSDSDLAAATKGFTPEIEQRNREENAGLRYDLVDRAEAASQVDDPMQATAAFRREGALGEFREEAP